MNYWVASLGIFDLEYWVILFGIIYFVVLLLVTYCLLPETRKRQKDYRPYESNLRNIILCRQILLFFLPLIIVFFYDPTVASQYFVGLITLGLSINVFWVVQVPQLTKANLYIDFSVDGIGDFKPFLKLKPDTEYVIYTRLYNLGFHTLKNMMVLIYFKKGFDVISEESKYKDIDFQKEFSVQNCNYGAAFPPNKNFQTISPQEWFIFPLIVKTPKTGLDREIEVLIQSENSWGITKYLFKVKTLY